MLCDDFRTVCVFYCVYYFYFRTFSFMPLWIMFATNPLFSLSLFSIENMKSNTMAITRRWNKFNYWYFVSRRYIFNFDIIRKLRIYIYICTIYMYMYAYIYRMDELFVVNAIMVQSYTAHVWHMDVFFFLFLPNFSRLIND